MNMLSKSFTFVVLCAAFIIPARPQAVPDEKDEIGAADQEWAH
jgi:hypothetical protein